MDGKIKKSVFYKGDIIGIVCVTVFSVFFSLFAFLSYSNQEMNGVYAFGGFVLLLIFVDVCLIFKLLKTRREVNNLLEFGECVNGQIVDYMIFNRGETRVMGKIVKVHYGYSLRVEYNGKEYKSKEISSIENINAGDYVKIYINNSNKNIKFYVDTDSIIKNPEGKKEWPVHDSDLLEKIYVRNDFYDD